MNKAQLIDAVATEAGITKVDAKRSIDAFIKVLSTSLQDDEKVTIVGFGTFLTAAKQGRVGRNPRTGESIKIAPKKVVKFRCSLDLN